MARKLISGNDVLSFNPANGTIVINGFVPLSKLLLVNNATKNVSLFNFSDPNTPAIVTYNSDNKTTTIDVSYNTTSMSSSDQIQVYYEKEELEIKPARTYRDPVSKFRVSNPQTLIDTDFEYGQQPTKWESVKLVNNVPTSYSSPFTENSISISAINVSAGDDVMTITTTDQHNLPLGGVVEINNLTDSKYEGTFIVKTSSSNKFSVKLPFKSDKSGELSTIYSVAYKGAFYTGSLIPINDVTTSTGAASTLTISTQNLHGFNNGTKLYLKNSRATKKFNFNVPSAVVGIGSTQYRSQISGIGGSPELEYYSKDKIITEEIIGKFEINIPDTNINTSNGEITYNSTQQFGSAVGLGSTVSGIGTNNVVVFYTPAGNSPMTKAGSPSPTNIFNFTPFRIISSSTNNGITTFKIGEAYNSSSIFVPDGDGTVLFGNHRFIKGYRITEFAYQYQIKFDTEVDFVEGDKIIINSSYYSTSTYENISVYDSITGAYITANNGQYNTSSYPYYVYTISSVSADKKSVNVKSGLSSFVNRNLVTYAPAHIWSASAVKDHPLANSFYLSPSAGFSTDLYDNYQYVLYRNTSSASRIPALSDNTNYILQQVNTNGWYKIYNANNSSDPSASWNNPINLYYNVPNNPSLPLNTNGTVNNVLTVGIHTITSSRILKNANTISLPARGGLENNADVVYNSTVSSIGNLIANNTYKVKTEDTSIGSDRFRLSTSSEVAKFHGISYSANQSFADFYIYDLEDRITFDSSAVDGIITAGIQNGATIQVSGVNFSNPVKKYFINNSFKVSSINNYSSVPKFEASSPTNTRRYIYRVRVDVPLNGTFNTKTSINVFDNTDRTSFANSKITGIQELNLNVTGVAGTHILSQNIDGAVDDVYKLENASSNGFIFNTDSEIPQITKNIVGFANSSSSNIGFNSTSARMVVTNNNTASATVTHSNGGSGAWVSAASTIGYNAPVSVKFQMASGGSYYFAVGLTTNTTGLTNLNYSNGYTLFQYSGIHLVGNYRRAYYRNIGNGVRDNDINANNVYEISYGTDGYITVYKNNVKIDSKFVGIGLSLRPFVSAYDNFYTYSMNASNITLGGMGLPFVSGSTNYLKLTSHNFSDGAQVTYQVEPSSSEAIGPLVHNQNYYVRVLDGDFVGLTTNAVDAIDRTESLIGFTTSGSSAATHKLITNSVKGYLNGKGSVAITTSSTLVNGTNTNFLSDFSNGDTFRVYKLAPSGNNPGNYFESKIASIKGDKVLKLENIPDFENTSASYFKETGLYPVSDGKVVHRPFDGGVSMYTGLTPNTKVIRQTRRYFRYQSGKGIQVSMAVNFNPTYDIDTLSAVGTGLTSYYTVRSKFPHNISTNSPDSQQRIVLSNVVGSASTFFNRKTTETGFKIITVNDDFKFTVDIENKVSTNDISGFPQYSIQNWQDAAIRCGLFDDQNGFFFEYDGSQLYAVRRSSTQQLSGKFETGRNSHIVKGTNSALTKQVVVDDYIVIRGQTYKVISVLNDTTLSIQPSYRGNSTTDIVISKVIDTKVPQSQWNIDRMDATGDSGYKLDISKIQMIYMDYSWYGAGSIRFGFKDTYGEVRYCHEFIHNNVFTESYFRSGNIPARYEVETFGDPLYSPSLSHWGVSVIMDGRYDDDKAYLFTADSKTLPFTNDGYSKPFTGTVTIGSDTITNIDASEYSSLVVGQELVHIPSSTPVYTNIQQGSVITSLEIDTSTLTSKVPGTGIRYRIKMSKPAIASGSLSGLYAFSGTSATLQSDIPLVSIRLSPSVDNGNIGNLGFRDIINRMQLTLKSAGVLTTHDCEVRLILNGKLSDESFSAVTSPSLSQIYKHNIGDTISEGIAIFSFRAQGGGPLIPPSSTTPTLIGRRSFSGTEVSLDELALLGNSILGGDGTFPDGPDILTLAVRPIDTSTINGGSPMIVTGRITWAEAQA